MDHRLLLALSSAAEAIHAEAREHKRVAEEHRRRARALMRKLELIQRECARNGIQLEITQAPSRRESQ